MLVTALVLLGSGAPGLDADQAAEERRTCASLRERVAARALERFPLAITMSDPEDKYDDLDPRVLALAPDRFYATLAQRLDDGRFGPPAAPSPISPASRLVDACRSIAP